MSTTSLDIRALGIWWHTREDTISYSYKLIISPQMLVVSSFKLKFNLLSSQFTRTNREFDHEDDEYIVDKEVKTTTTTKYSEYPHI